MQAKVYNLPEISFVGGETHDSLQKQEECLVHLVQRLLFL